MTANENAIVGDRRQTDATRMLRQRANEIGLLIGLIVLYLFLSFFAPNFFTVANQLNILRDAAFVGIIAWGMTFILIAGEIDISVGPHVAFAGG